MLQHTVRYSSLLRVTFARAVYPDLPGHLYVLALYTCVSFSLDYVAISSLAIPSAWHFQREGVKFLPSVCT